jgi:hypothetical protein
MNVQHSGGLVTKRLQFNPTLALRAWKKDSLASATLGEKLFLLSDHRDYSQWERATFLHL